MASWFQGLKFFFFSKALILFGKVFFKLRITGLENLPSTGPGILVANHRSYLDILLIGIVLDGQGLLRRAWWVIGKTTFHNPFLHFLFAVSPVIIVNGTVRKAEAALKDGCFITIFPEGFYAWRKFLYDRGKEKTEPVRNIGTSAAILGFKTGCPIVPIWIKGTYEAMPPYCFFPKRGELSLRIGKPFRFEVPEPEDVTDEMIAERADFVMKQVEALQ